MTTLRSLLLCGILMGGIGLRCVTTVYAATQSGDLIRSSSQPDVYYVGPNLKRYVFPNEKIYSSWYADFSQVKIVTAQELAGFSIGGAVTYRPGTHLVKLTTDPKTYAVAKGGVLRWIQTEALAQQLYGFDWAKNVEDLPDAFFASYSIGTPINVMGDYSSSAEMGSSPTIAIEKNILPPATPQPPVSPPPVEAVPTSTITLTLSLSKPVIRPGDIESISANASSPDGIFDVKLFLDDLLVQNCHSGMCTGETVIPLTTAKPTYVVKAIATSMLGQIRTETRSLTTTTSSMGLVKVSVTHSTITPSQVAEVVVDSDPSIAIIRTDIYVDGGSIKACVTSSLQCRWSDLISGSVGSVHDVYGLVTDSLGRTYLSDHLTITIGNHDSPIVTTVLPKTNVATNEFIDVLVSASDDEGVGGTAIFANGNLLKNCAGSATCSFKAGPWTEAQTIHFSGSAIDAFGIQATSSEVLVHVQ